MLPRSEAAAQSLISRGDVVFLVVSAGAVVCAVHNDLWLTDETTEGHSASEDGLASWAQPLGNTGVLLPVFALTYEAARLSRDVDAAHRVLRIGLAGGVAGGVAFVLKEAVGRSRPSESPSNPGDVDPFTGHASFPSGHATVAFAVAAAIDRETSSGWVPWVAYPTAALVG